MKKILSTILTLVIVALPLAAQCSAEQYFCDNSGNCIVKVQDSNAKSKSSKIGSFFSKAFLGIIAFAGTTAALYKWSPKGEVVDLAKKGYNEYLIPALSSVKGKVLVPSKNYISNLCLEKKEDRSCEKTVSQFADEKFNATKEAWSKFTNYCLQNGKDGFCKMTVSDLGNEIVEVYKNNYNAVKNEILNSNNFNGTKDFNETNNG